MDVVGEWTGQSAAHLQAALRESNEGFARRLGVAVRTVAAWHSDPDIVPRSEMQQALDTTYEKAGDSVRRRFELLTRPALSAAKAQALRVAIAVVVRGSDVLLVYRRGDASLSWQFPAGMVKPGADAQAVAAQETYAETGVHCAIAEELGSRLHPTTGVLASYFLCTHLAGEASNRDQIENVDVQWVPISALPRFIPSDKLYPPIKAALEALA